MLKMYDEKGPVWNLFLSFRWSGENGLFSTIRYLDSCETSHIDAFIDSNLVFQRSLHVTKRAAGVI